MSPTATIASVVVGLAVVAWLFQTDIPVDPWAKRQQDEKPAQKPSVGIALTDSGVTRGGGPRSPSNGDSGADGPVPTASFGDQAGSTTRPVVVNNGPEFGLAAKLNGTFVGVNYIGDAPSAKADGDAPWITFRRDGTFVSHNMSMAEVETDPNVAGPPPFDPGSGQYKLYGNTLELSFTDGLARRKASFRTYTIVPIDGVDNTISAVTAITIQGKVFKLDTER